MLKVRQEDAEVSRLCKCAYQLHKVSITSVTYKRNYGYFIDIFFA